MGHAGLCLATAEKGECLDSWVSFPWLVLHPAGGNPWFLVSVPVPAPVGISPVVQGLLLATVLQPR